MDKFEDGGPAFPMSGDPAVDFDRGMSLRDWFAGQVITNALPIAPTDKETYLFVAQHAYQLADAMLTARKPKTEA